MKPIIIFCWMYLTRRSNVCAESKAVKRLCGEQDEGFAISAKSLAKALVDEGLIEQDESGTNTKTMRFGGRLKRVMLLRKDKANKLISV